MVTSNYKWSGGELLVSATAKYLSQRREQEDFAYTQTMCQETSQARNVSAKGTSTQRMDGKAFRVFTAVSRPHLTVNKMAVPKKCH